VPVWETPPDALSSRTSLWSAKGQPYYISSSKIKHNQGSQIHDSQLFLQWVSALSRSSFEAIRRIHQYTVGHSSAALDKSLTSTSSRAYARQLSRRVKEAPRRILLWDASCAVLSPTLSTTSSNSMEKRTCKAYPPPQTTDSSAELDHHQTVIPWKSQSVLGQNHQPITA